MGKQNEKIVYSEYYLEVIFDMSMKKIFLLSLLHSFVFYFFLTIFNVIKYSWNT